ncbi:MAG: hypothetical protein SXQ77_09620 [Halobacteria archaeon]|nr:hypothetical protein [Halobacteria archaeon]
MTHQADFREFIKLRLGLVVGIALVVATATLGLIDLFSTFGISALPLYVHAGVGAILFPLSVFVMEYRGLSEPDALKFGLVLTLASVFFFLLLSEGVGKFVNGFFEIGAGTMFYALSVGLVSATVIVMWAQKNFREPLPPSNSNTNKPGSYLRRD